MKTIRVENFMCHEHLKVEFKYALTMQLTCVRPQALLPWSHRKAWDVRPELAVTCRKYHCLLQAFCQLHFWDQRLWQECDAPGPAVLPGRGCSADRAGSGCQGPHQVWSSPAGGLRDDLEHRCGLSGAKRLRFGQCKGLAAEPVATGRLCLSWVWCAEHDWAFMLKAQPRSKAMHASLFQVQVLLTAAVLNMVLSVLS